MSKKSSAAKTADQTPTVINSSQNSKSQVRERESMISRQNRSPKYKDIAKSTLSISNQTDKPKRIGVLQKKRENYESFSGLTRVKPDTKSKSKNKAIRMKSPMGSSRN